ncbi:hypothetical protein JIN85_08865 [Luteolibacter pohnpeiensis]|uniref:alpha-L-rhamnosidase n=1 Tax=Luteolibacter pohnpeiensis TaxID=454153 RepID=A0A934S765_9BACT|nr:LamG-like jellyroll fold domain-containing protein [Luteolibacter pohnpeiensis]MBK1882525.1 hypothetical protein [Luteolibacter pohnpeiensis]
MYASRNIQLTAFLVSNLAAGGATPATRPYPNSSFYHQWHLDESTTPFVDTGTGPSFPLVAIGSITPGAESASNFGTSVTLSGAGDGLFGGVEENAVADILGPNHTTAGWTIEALVNFSSVTGGQREIVSMDNEGSNRPFQFVLSDNGSNLRFHSISGDGTPHNAPIPTSGIHAFVANTWYHVAVTYTGDETQANNLRIYWTRVDAGVTEANLIGSFSMTADVSSGTGDFAIGNELRDTGGSSEGLRGQIDEVTISEGPKAADDFIFVNMTDDDGDSLPDEWEQQIIDSDDDDAIRTLADVLPDDDFDGDTLTNLQEYQIGTNPTVAEDPADLDGDSLPDEWETTHFGSIFAQNAAGDPDGDLFTNLEEYQNGTDPKVDDDPKDRDADSLPDAWEEQYFGSLEQDGSGDPDGDGFSNAAEFSAETLPNDAGSVPGDADGDGLSDDWVLRHFANTTALPGDDPDNDGFDNTSEQAAGTDPNDPEDKPGSPADPFRPNGLMVDLLAMPHLTTIPDQFPEFTWIFNPRQRGESQIAYQILVSSTPLLAGTNHGDVWDSGKIDGSDSVNIDYLGTALSRGTTYSWRVRTWGTDDAPSAWSAIQSFTIESTAPQSNARTIYQSSSNERNGYNWAGRYKPSFGSVVAPIRVIDKGEGRYFIDFGRDGFGYLTLRLNGAFSGKTLTTRFSEQASGSTVVGGGGTTTNPDNARTTTSLANGETLYEIHSPNVSGSGIDVSSIAGGRVVPFRYVEISDCPAEITAENIRQHVLHVPFDESAARFASSDATLDAVWEMCRYSMEATSFAGVYVDGDRERLPYEADAYINQLGHYSVDREFTTARYSLEWLLDHSTWPTEWKLHFPLMAWADYMYTGNLDALEANYDSLVAHVAQYQSDVRNDGILSHSTDNIVDWPTGERDGYVLTSENTVVNAFYYKSCRILADIAGLLGKTTDQATFTSRADRLESSFNQAFWNGSLFKDGESTTHTSAHSNFFPLALGIEPPDKQSVLDFLKTKRMACSVYGSQYLLEALFEGEEADYAIGLMKDNSTTYDRHWWNMIKKGATITMEAWDNSYKPNQDWSHAWGSVPANIIPRYVLGLTPSSPGFATARIKPQLGTGDGILGLTHASGVIPTIRGPVEISVENSPSSFRLTVALPGTMLATVMVPSKGLTNPFLMVDGVSTQAPVENGYLILENLTPGKHEIWLSDTATADAETLKENWKAAMFGTGEETSSLSDDHADPDGDGLSNLEEFAANTDPLNADDNFKIKSHYIHNSADRFELVIPVRKGRIYILERTTDLSQIPWESISSSVVQNTSGELLMADDSPPASRAFYRVRVEPP